MNDASLKRVLFWLSGGTAAIGGACLALALWIIWPLVWVMDCLTWNVYIHRGVLVLSAVGLSVALVRRSTIIAFCSLAFVAVFWSCDTAFYRLEWRECLEERGRLGHGGSGTKPMGEWTGDIECALSCGDPRSVLVFQFANVSCKTQSVTINWQRGDSITNVINTLGERSGCKLETEISGNWCGKGLVFGSRYHVTIYPVEHYDTNEALPGLTPQVMPTMPIPGVR